MNFKEYTKYHNIPMGFTEEDYEIMIDINPYSPSKWWFPTPHEQWNKQYMMGWQSGMYSGFRKIVDWIKDKYEAPGWLMGREDFRKMFADLTEDLNFGLKKKDNITE